MLNSNETSSQVIAQGEALGFSARPAIQNDVTAARRAIADHIASDDRNSGDDYARLDELLEILYLAEIAAGELN